MQFREDGRKIYCSVPVFDPKSRRARQRMVCTLDLFSPKPPEPDDFPFGEADQKASWLKEIEIEIAERKALEEERVLNALPRNFARIVDQVVKAVSEGTLSQSALENVSCHVSRLAAELAAEGRTNRGNPSLSGELQHIATNVDWVSSVAHDGQ